ncbi:TPA: NADP-dependent malic enzyme [Enterococcus faecalis]|uniref:Malic enzyme, NAD binding domain protein n=2 Tax=Enterococcus TaxID=1350 RepID=A0ABC9P7M9_ENTFL|nr:NADP-dependent malic enzyme [Enterococcus faecalis]EFM65495.1 malic enzyme, NAD binding domain protein [Enterococcus faecalis TX0411]EFQ16753.1 malic enzyme, NAD binding domain protein [Enterococcus faecalis EnGen0311]EFU07446.1 malic enzyme, NAD binding domain protein [Enterococcus faecalis TX0645]EFU91005.1 malic enzyme, NAD binding domain protein [Enterococcus faecalis TX0630]EPI07070.1 putative NAD-dependent malic enzyme [Enterococcus faecalis 20.SD.W.06]EPI35447.1 putative NAD-depende
MLHQIEKRQPVKGSDNVLEEVLAIHQKNIGVLSLEATEAVLNHHDLAKMYTPGVAELSLMIAQNHELAREWTISGKLIAVITDGSAVLGLGNMGTQAGLPIVEGKALLYKNLAGVDAIPLALEQKSVDEMVQTIENLQNSFAGIHLEDISAPKCFEIEEKLQQRLNIPVYHDDQEGTAIVVLAGLINAAKIKGKPLNELRVVINGVGASGVATAKLCIQAGITHLTLVDRQGVLREEDPTLNPYQRALLRQVIKPSVENKDLATAVVNQDVFLGLSEADVLTPALIKSMNQDPIIFALANPKPEIEPALAQANGVRLLATGSSKYPNQVNNILAFPGLFKGLLAAKGRKVDVGLQMTVARSLAAMISEPTAEKFIPNVFDGGVVDTVFNAVLDYIKQEKATAEEGT